MTEFDFDIFRENHGGKCSAAFVVDGKYFDAIIGDFDDTAESVLGGIQPKTAFSLALKKSDIKAAGFVFLRELLRKSIFLLDEQNGIDKLRFVVRSARAHPASEIAHLTIREA